MRTLSLSLGLVQSALSGVSVATLRHMKGQSKRTFSLRAGSWCDTLLREAA
jgi:hypothetical protein